MIEFSNISLFGFHNEVDIIETTIIKSLLRIKLYYMLYTGIGDNVIKP